MPTVAVVAFGVYFLLTGVPRIVANERRWAEDEAKKVSLELKAGETPPDFVWEYGKGVLDGENWRGIFPKSMTWKDWHSRGAKRKADMWGWRDVGKVRVVWVRDGRKIYGKSTGIRELDYHLLFWVFGILAMVSLVATSAFTIYSLVTYAKSRDDFLAATAHDLTTPLAGLRLSIGRDDAEAHNLAERMTRLIANLRDFMRLGAKKTFAKDRFDLRKAYEEAYKPFSADFRDIFDGADIVASEEASPTVSGDETATIQIIWNLLGNELKYAAPYGPIAVRIAQDGNYAILEISDSGPGMTKRQMARAFDRYWRARTALASGKGGFGIGLCVAREFARGMGGDLALRPNNPKGCIFTLKLPAARQV